MKIQFFKDILKSKTEGNGFKYSQGRVYLFAFVLSYIATLVYLLFKPINPYIQVIIDALQWAILLFAAYVFGAKGVDATKQIFKTAKDNKIAENKPVDDVQPTPKEEDLTT